MMNTLQAAMYSRYGRKVGRMEVPSVKKLYDTYISQLSELCMFSAGSQCHGLFCYQNEIKKKNIHNKHTQI